MPTVSKVGVASILDHMHPFSVEILGTTLRCPIKQMYDIVSLLLRLGYIQFC